MRSGRPIASTTAWSLVVNPPRERPMAAASAPLLRPLHQRGLSKSCYRSGHIQSRAYQPRHETASPRRPHATSAENGSGLWSIRQKPPVDRASGPHCRPSTGSPSTNSRLSAPLRPGSPIRPGRWFLSRLHCSSVSVRLLKARLP